MKSLINYYYNLYPNKIISQDNFFYFWLNDEKFYFVPFNNDVNIVKIIYEKLLFENKKVNHIIYNKDKNMVTNFKNVNYVLLNVKCIETEIIDLQDFFSIKIEGRGVDWGEVWSNKIDYLEYQVNQRALGKEHILNSFSYFVGLAENAIQYYNMLTLKDISVSIQHKRVYCKNYAINYYNPVNMIIDYEVRDISEYIKSAFFSNCFNETDVLNYINNLKLNSIMINLLYVRLLFPTYYFDLYEKLLNDEKNEKELFELLNKVYDYEKFLKKFYLSYFKVYNLLKIDWLTDFIE